MMLLLEILLGIVIVLAIILAFPVRFRFFLLDKTGYFELQWLWFKSRSSFPAKKSTEPAKAVESDGKAITTPSEPEPESTGIHINFSFGKKKSSPSEPNQPGGSDELTPSTDQKKKNADKSEPEVAWFALIVEEQKRFVKILKQFLRMIGRLLKVPSCEECRCRIQFGGEDPAQIGFLYGIGCAILPLKPQRLDLAFDGDFVEGVWRWESSLIMKVVPLRIIIWILLEILRFPWITVLLLWLAYRQHRKPVT